MKIRTGFVSNSSSSSYVIVLEKSVYDQLLSQLTDLQKDILVFLSGRDESATQEFMGHTVVTIQYTEGNYSSLDDYTEGMGETGYQGIREKKLREAQEKALKGDEDATWGDIEIEEDNIDAQEEWEKVIEKIDALPKDKVLRFEQDM